MLHGAAGVFRTTEAHEKSSAFNFTLRCFCGKKLEKFSLSGTRKLLEAFYMFARNSQ